MRNRGRQIIKRRNDKINWYATLELKIKYIRKGSLITIEAVVIFLLPATPLRLSIFIEVMIEKSKRLSNMNLKKGYNDTNTSYNRKKKTKRETL